MNVPITAAPAAQKPIDIDTFMEALFEGHQETPVLVRNERDPTDADAWDNFRTYRWRKGEQLTGCVYYGISTIRDDNPRATHPDRTVPKLAKTYVIPLDDVGNPEKTSVAPEETERRLPPSYKLESSDGSFQWGYILESPIEPAQAAALLEAIVQAGYGDKAAVGAHRIMRVPGSIHLDKDGFKSRIIEWHPERVYPWSMIAQRLGVVPTDTPKLSDGPVELPPGMVDPEFEWLARNGYVHGTGPNRRGYWRVTCPQEHLHDPTKPIDRGTGYRPGKPSDFNCKHAHCKDFKMGKLRAWILEQDPGADLSPIPREALQAFGAKLAAQLASDQKNALAVRYEELKTRKGDLT